MLAITLASILPEILVIAAILVVVFIIFVLGKFLAGLLVNSIVGLIAIFAVNYLFGLGIPYSWPVIIATALLGLPAVLVIIILKLGGII